MIARDQERMESATKATADARRADGSRESGRRASLMTAAHSRRRKSHLPCMSKVIYSRRAQRIPLNPPSVPLE